MAPRESGLRHTHIVDNEFCLPVNFMDVSDAFSLLGRIPEIKKTISLDMFPFLLLLISVLFVMNQLQIFSRPAKAC
jgi:hypothetical protein